MAFLAIEASNKLPDQFLLFDADGALWLTNAAGTERRLVAKLSTITAFDKPIAMTLHEPYACVVERFGLHGAVVDLRNGAVREIQREDYHANVSSYSHAFIEHDGAMLFLHQTQWNRLDLMDLESGRRLTERRIHYNYKPEERDENGVVTSPKIDESENHLDFFHSRLHVSPNHKTFLSNGWIWSPVDTIIAYDVEEFFRSFDPGGIMTEFGGGYNWDRPCTFIDDDTFAVIVDDTLDPEEQETEGYLPLWFYRISDAQPRRDYRHVNAYRKLPCPAFGLNEHREVHGDLYYDPNRKNLVALSDKGGFLLDLDGSIKAHDPEVARVERTSHSDFGSKYVRGSDDWKYSVVGACFYRFHHEKHCVEQRMIAVR